MLTRVKFIFELIIACFIALAAFSRTDACTCFAVYGNKIFYGMNFDYPSVGLRFSIVEYEGNKIFFAQFVEDQIAKSICGMNQSGLFSSMQMLYPEVNTWHYPGENEVDLYAAYITSLMNADSIGEINDYLDSTGVRVIHCYGLSLHDFFADKYGTACVLEVGGTENLFTYAENNFLVMTNFPNNKFIGDSLNDIYGVGADRYKTAYRYINDNIGSFDYEDGIEVLKRTCQKSGSFRTQVSLLFNPVNNEIFIMIGRDFSKVWKVSIDNSTIETYSGFDSYCILPLTAEGIDSSTLINLTGLEDQQENLQFGFSLDQNFPNPFNPSTTIHFSVEKTVNVTLRVFDVLGKEIHTLVDEVKMPGEYNVRFDAPVTGTLPSGIYFYRITAGDFVETRKMVLLK